MVIFQKTVRRWLRNPFCGRVEKPLANSEAYWEQYGQHPREENRATLQPRHQRPRAEVPDAPTPFNGNRDDGNERYNVFIRASQERVLVSIYILS